VDRPTKLADIAGESILIAGGARAILLQIAHPRIGTAIAAHSDFATRPMDRLDNTLTYVYAIVYGTPAHKRAVIEAVNGAHSSIRDTTDPRLQLWVAATLYDTAIAVFERVYGPIDDAAAESIYREYANIGVALQMPIELWPANRAAFAEYWATAMGELRVSPDAKAIARDILNSRAIPMWLRAGMPLARLVTAGLLPDQLRSEFALPWSEVRARRFERAFLIVSALYRPLPKSLRWMPRNRYLAALRRRGARQQP
jgi:uncharacterized protein (DUF2236 family)